MPVRSLQSTSLSLFETAHEQNLLVNVQASQLSSALHKLSQMVQYECNDDRRAAAISEVRQSYTTNNALQATQADLRHLLAELCS